MSILRLIAACAAFFACVLYGRRRRKRDAESLALMEDLTADLKFFADCIKKERLPVESIVNRLSVKGRCKTAWASTIDLMKQGSGFNSAFDKSCRTIVQGRAKELIEHMFSKDSEPASYKLLDRISETAVKLEITAKEERKRLDEKTKVAGSLSLFAGIAAALLIL